MLTQLQGHLTSIYRVDPGYDVMDFLVICSGTSNRHVKSLAENVILKLARSQRRSARAQAQTRALRRSRGTR